MSTPLRALVVAGDRLARAGLAATLEAEGITVVGRLDPSDAGSEAAREMLDAFRADVIVADFGGPGADVQATAERLGTLLESLVGAGEGDGLDDPEGGDGDGPPLVALIDVAAEARLARAYGARGVLDREVSQEALAAALTAVSAGLVVVTPAFAATGGAPSSAQSDDVLLEPLTPRESEVLAHIADGRSNRQIASVLSISPHTVKDHVDAILSKLGASSRTEAAVRAARLGLISL